ncbi:Mitochondrial RNA helicase [Tieghemostelium lacteum]|uniref:RNA helicase n=1 Tax=Tieghemostelium lacteum TaxID=361077 RepID=A0A151ZGC0_TIELA|nr:Mitochondrial RNA helicase [Tieghemostelium lacteum]|eukprot:KYQ93013.1 Mitochondrial RNA helicase [Tieghemostelium lacteum]
MLRILQNNQILKYNNINLIKKCLIPNLTNHSNSIISFSSISGSKNLLSSNYSKLLLTNHYSTLNSNNITNTTSENSIQDSLLNTFQPLINPTTKDVNTHNKNNNNEGEESITIDITFLKKKYTLTLPSNTDIQTIMTPKFFYGNFDSGIKLIRLKTFICTDNDGQNLPRNLKLNQMNSKNISLHIVKKEYAHDTQELSSKDIFKQIIEDFNVDIPLEGEKMDMFLDSFISELAVTSPKTLHTMKIDNSVRKHLIVHLRDHYRSNWATKDKNTLVEELANLKYPHSWFPEARKYKRHFVLHVGPTNSGKTFNALKRLTEAESGVYCGPLRLLAHEVYDKIIDKGISCNLMTGQTKIIDKDANHTACTIETLSTDQMVEVAVIDEFQMVSDLQRGWAWTKAILGVPAAEVHLCGDNTAVNLVQKICAITGDSMEIKNYERLAELRLSPKIPKPKELKKGDCVIAFTRKKILEMKDLFEKKYGYKCGVVYGPLPPLTRVNQAKLFNEEEFDILLATDAIGMGINLNIKRIIFSSMMKFDGENQRNLYDSEIKQIAGRAGRYKSDEKAKGLVTSFERRDLEAIGKALDSSNIASERAAVFPQYQQLELFSKHEDNSNYSFSELLSNFIEYTNLDELYFLESFDKKIEILTLIDHIDLPIKDKFNFLLAPISNTNPYAKEYLQLFAKYIESGEEVPFLIDVPELPNMKGLGFYRQHLSEYLENLENLYNIVDCYLWLAQKYENFTKTLEAQNVSIELSERISEALNFKILKKHQPRTQTLNYQHVIGEDGKPMKSLKNILLMEPRKRREYLEEKNKKADKKRKNQLKAKAFIEAKKVRVEHNKLLQQQYYEKKQQKLEETQNKLEQK